MNIFSPSKEIFILTSLPESSILSTVFFISALLCIRKVEAASLSVATPVRASTRRNVDTERLCVELVAARARAR